MPICPCVEHPEDAVCSFRRTHTQYPSETLRKCHLILQRGSSNALIVCQIHTLKLVRRCGSLLHAAQTQHHISHRPFLIIAQTIHYANRLDRRCVVLDEYRIGVLAPNATHCPLLPTSTIACSNNALMRTDTKARRTATRGGWDGGAYGSFNVCKLGERRGVGLKRAAILHRREISCTRTSCITIQTNA